MEKKMETTMMGYVGTTIRIHSFFPSQPKVILARVFLHHPPLGTALARHRKPKRWIPRALWGLGHINNDMNRED